MSGHWRHKLKVNIKRNDRVVVISGKDRGKTGKVLAVFPRLGKVIVERVNFAKHHEKRRGYMQQGGIIERELPIDISNVMLICPRCNRQTRTSRKVLETGFRVRICRKCREVAERE
ncbi:TPA: 50S ribosomal protein L24 [Candidatus Poribacteria bacterium]|nr:50S ribosomal protein L24 [Candidatus Poribacteria bacterium]